MGAMFGKHEVIVYRRDATCNSPRARDWLRGKMIDCPTSALWLPASDAVASLRSGQAYLMKPFMPHDRLWVVRRVVSPVGSCQLWPLARRAPGSDIGRCGHQNAFSKIS